MSDLLESAMDPCPCGFPCELFRRADAAGLSLEVRPRRDPREVWPIRFATDEALRGAEAGVVDELTFRSYAYNRGYGVTPEHWAREFPKADVEAMERRYQAELGQRRHEAIERRALQPIWPFEATR